MSWYGDAWNYGKDLLGVGDPANPPDAGQGSATNPNRAYLDAQSNLTSQQKLFQADQDRNNAQGIQNGQTGVVNGLGTSIAGFNNTINNPGASSVAQTQLAQNNGQIARTALGNAAGVGGANAFAARRQAMSSIADANTGTAQSAALLRAHEVESAQQQKLAAEQAQGNIFGQQAAVNANVLGTDTAAAGGFNNTASSGRTSAEQQQIDARNRQKDDRGKFGGKIIDAGSSLLGML